MNMNYEQIDKKYKDIIAKLDEKLSDDTVLDEKLLNVTDKSIAYPKSNQVVILAGGAGSGKGFILQNFLSIEGKVFDTDQYKEAILNYNIESLRKDFAEFSGRHIESLKLTDPHDVSLLHSFVKDKNIYIKRMVSFFKGQEPLKEKANVIFDVTLKDIEDLKELSKYCISMGGYKKENIHIVWILNDFEMANKQNKERSRIVSDDILLKTHSGASKTMKEILTENYRQYMDGNIFVMFNKANVDNLITFTNNAIIVDKYLAVLVKEKNKPTNKYMIDAIIDKINNYVPSETKW